MSCNLKACLLVVSGYIAHCDKLHNTYETTKYNIKLLVASDQKDDIHLTNSYDFSCT